jgi:hypothetical protein
MPTGLLHPYDPTGLVREDVRFANVGGGLIASVTYEGTNRDIADVYTLTASGASGATATITVTTASGKGPYHDTVFAAVAFDGSTRRDLVPGVATTLPVTTPANGNSSTVSVGIYAGVRMAGNPTGTQLKWTTGINSPGEVSVASGQPGFLGKTVIINDGSEAVASALAVRHPVAKLINKTGPWGLQYVEVVDDQPSEYVLSGVIQPIKLTFANYLAGSPNKIDVLAADGGAAASFTVLEIGGSATPIASLQLKADAATRYQITAGPTHLIGLIFCIATTARNTSAENVPVWNNRTVWMAPDVSGSAGTWSQVSVVLTQAAQPSGVVNAAGSVILWEKLDISALGLPDFFQGDITLEYAKTGEAAWFA